MDYKDICKRSQTDVPFGVIVIEGPAGDGYLPYIQFGQWVYLGKDKKSMDDLMSEPNNFEAITGTGFDEMVSARRDEEHAGFRFASQEEIDQIYF